MSLVTVTVAQWMTWFQDDSFPPGDTFAIADTAKNIRGLPAQMIGGLTSIKSTDESLILTYAQALYLLNATEPPYVQLSAPTGDTVECADTFANISNLSASDASYLNKIYGLQIAVADTASNIEQLTAAQALLLQQLGVQTITSTDFLVVLSAAEAVDLVNAINPGAITIVAPTNGTVVVAGTAADFEALNTFEIAALKPLGVQALTVNDDVRPEFSIDQLVLLTEASLTVNEAAGISISTSDLINDEANPTGTHPRRCLRCRRSPVGLHQQCPQSRGHCGHTATSRLHQRGQLGHLIGGPGRSTRECFAPRRRARRRHGHSRKLPGRFGRHER